jgi:hypothetical protein
MRYVYVLAALLFLTAGLASAEEYDATTIGFAHGFLMLIDANCEQHSVGESIPDPSGGQRAAMQAFAQTPSNVHIKTHQVNYGEALTIIYPATHANFIARCKASEQRFQTHVDGVLMSWSNGNGVGQFEIRLPTGVMRSFPFAVDANFPTVNGQKLGCDNQDDPNDCPLLSLVHFGKTKVRVFFTVVDGPGGNDDEHIHLVTLP